MCRVTRSPLDSHMLQLREALLAQKRVKRSSSTRTLLLGNYRRKKLESPVEADSDETKGFIFSLSICSMETDRMSNQQSYHTSWHWAVNQKQRQFTFFTCRFSFFFSNFGSLEWPPEQRHALWSLESFQRSAKQLTHFFFTVHTCVPTHHCTYISMEVEQFELMSLSSSSLALSMCRPIGRRRFVTPRTSGDSLVVALRDQKTMSLDPGRQWAPLSIHFFKMVGIQFNLIHRKSVSRRQAKCLVQWLHMWLKKHWRQLPWNERGASQRVEARFYLLCCSSEVKQHVLVKERGRAKQGQRHTSYQVFWSAKAESIGLLWPKAPVMHCSVFA